MIYFRTKYQMHKQRLEEENMADPDLVNLVRSYFDPVRWRWCRCLHLVQLLLLCILLSLQSQLAAPLSVHRLPPFARDPCLWQCSVVTVHAAAQLDGR